MLRWFPRRVRSISSRRRKPAAPSAVGETFEVRVLMSADGAALHQAKTAVDAKWFEQLQPPEAADGQTAGISRQKLQWNGHEVTFAGGEWILQFTPESRVTTAAEADRFFKSKGIPVTVAGGLGTAGQVLIRTEGINPQNVIRQFGALREVSYLEPNFLVETQRVPNDPLYPLMTGLQQSNDHDIDANEAWDVTTGSSSVVIGVIDTGVDYSHPDLVRNMWVNPGEIAGDGIDNDRNGFRDDVHGFDFFHWDGDPMDQIGHGTHVAGTIAAAGNNGQGTTGVAWNSSIMAIQIFDQAGNAATIAGIVAAVNYATMMKVDYGINVRATNNSWGGGEFSKSLRDAITLSGTADILFVASAGNGGLDEIGDNNDLQPQYPASFDSPNIISVAATDKRGRYASFTNFGAASVDVAAPGVQILSTVPGGYGYSSGTSMAAPHVTGVIALAAAANPELDITQLRQLILSTGDRITDATRSTASMRRVNAKVAVREATRLAGPADHFGVYRPQTLQFIFDTGKQGYEGEKPLSFGLSGDLPVTGDWNGDGRDEPGVFRVVNGLGFFYLDTGKPGFSGETPIQFGLAGDQPIAGDWNGDGKDEIGVYRPVGSQFFLDTGAPGYQSELPILFGLTGDVPIAGDWDGDGKDTVGVFRPAGGLFFRDVGKTGYDGETPIQFGLPGDLPLSGDWNADGRDDAGVFRPTGGLIFMDTGTPGYTGETPFQFGLPGDRPVAGRWIARIPVQASTTQTQSAQSGARLMSLDSIKLFSHFDQLRHGTETAPAVSAVAREDHALLHSPNQFSQRAISRGHEDRSALEFGAMFSSNDATPSTNHRLLETVFAEWGLLTQELADKT